MAMARIISIAAVVLSHSIPGSPNWDPDCCPAMTIGGVAYTLVGHGLVLPVCLTDCIYTRDGENNGNLYCFGAGVLPVVCSSPGRSHI
jgi:hypothetical protein